MPARFVTTESGQPSPATWSLASTSFGGFRIRRAARKIAKRCEPWFTLDTAGRLGNHREQAANAAGFITDRAIRKREITVFQISIAIQRKEPILNPKGFSTTDSFEFRSDDGPHVREDHFSRRAERHRMFRTTQDGPVAIVVKEPEVAAPRND